MIFSKLASEQLQKAWYKLTKSRAQVISYFQESTKPVSPYDIAKEREKLDVVTVYRTIEILESLHLVHKIWSLGGYVRCDLVDWSCADVCCHEFQVCKKCHSFAEVHGHHHHTLPWTGFRIEQHVSEQIGICGKCEQ